MLIDHVTIDNGDLTYIEANRPGRPFAAVLEPLGIELDGLSTLSEDSGDYLNPVASSGEVGFEGVRLANLLRVIKSPRNLELPSGTLAAGLRYRFAMVRNEVGATPGRSSSMPRASA